MIAIWWATSRKEEGNEGMRGSRRRRSSGRPMPSLYVFNNTEVECSAGERERERERVVSSLHGR